MHKPSSDLERVYKALEDQWEITDVTCDLPIIAELQKALRKGEWKITAAVYLARARRRQPARRDLARLP